MGIVLDSHPKLIKLFAETIMRSARMYGSEAPEGYANLLSPKQQQLVAEYIRNHRKTTNEHFF